MQLFIIRLSTIVIAICALFAYVGNDQPAALNLCLAGFLYGIAAFALAYEKPSPVVYTEPEAEDDSQDVEEEESAS